jgi:transposase InsO family protein
MPASQRTNFGHSSSDWEETRTQVCTRLDGPPEIINTDQGSQFTSPEFTRTLQEDGVMISMDGRGRWMDNILIEILWRSL